jgi:hypothetical protein
LHEPEKGWERGVRLDKQEWTSKNEIRSLASKASWSQISGSKNPFYGKSHSQETRIRIGKRAYLKGQNHPFFGKSLPCSPGFGKNHSRSKPVFVSEVYYESLSLASIALGRSINWVHSHGKLITIND